MRIIDLPSPGVFSGSATLRKDLVRAVSFAQTAAFRCPGYTPVIVKSLEVCLNHILDELAKLHVETELEGTIVPVIEPPVEPPVTPVEADLADTGTPGAEDAQVDPVGAPGQPEAASEAPDVKLPSILRKRKN